MTTYITLLRGINVAGQKLIKMDELRGRFESMKFKNVKTYIQSGNIIFDTSATSETALVKKIERTLHKSTGHQIPVFLRTISEIDAIVKANPFKKVKSHSESKMFVSFLSMKLNTRPKLPLWSVKRDVEIIAITGRQIFSLSHAVKGRYGFPNNFAEKEFTVSATTRNWNTVCKLMKLSSD